MIAAKNSVRNFRGLILQDGGELDRGLWTRYNPANRPPLDSWTAVLFWLGLVTATIRWRRTYTWWPYFLPLVIAEVFSTGTPDLARGIIFAPFYFLFIGILFEEALRRIPNVFGRGGLFAGIMALVAFIGVNNVRDYFDWQSEPMVQEWRLPGVDRCEFDLWHGMAIKAANAGEPRHNMVDGLRFDALRREFDCSEIVRNALPPLPDAAAPQRDAQRRQDLESVRTALLAYYQQNGAFPSTNDNVQTLCQGGGDAGCELNAFLRPVPSDPGGGIVKQGYWYVSDGESFTVYAQLEVGARECADVPAALTHNDKMICVSGGPP